MHVDDGERPEIAHIAQDWTRQQELTETLARFHQRAAADPHLWKDEQAADALRAASELRAVEYELALLYLQQERNGRAAQDAATGAGQAITSRPVAETVSGVEWEDAIHRAHAIAAQEESEHEIELLRARYPEHDLVRRVDRDRQSRLRSLLDRLIEMQPEAAREIDDTWHQIRVRPSTTPGPRVGRWERQTGDWLVAFLEPLLTAE